MVEQEIIVSRQNKNVVELNKLFDRKERRARGLFRFDGIKLYEEAVKKGVELVTVALRASSRESVLATLSEHGVSLPDAEKMRVLLLSDEVFDKISEEKSPEGIICVAKYIDKFQKNVTIYNSADFLPTVGETVVLLEAVRDPSNIGAIIRSAAAMGVDRLILSRDCADAYNPKAIRASMGALFDQRMDLVEDLPEAIRAIRGTGRRVFAAALHRDAALLGREPLRAGDCVVIGNEGHGLSDEVVLACDRCIFIPMTDRAESYNASVAAALLMWEFSRVRK